MKRKPTFNFYLCCLAIFLTATLSQCTNKEGKKAQETRKRPPNIVVIFMDDMGYGDLDTYGATDYQTPNLDKLAAEGMRFTNFYAAQPICSASRAGILTGCYPNRVGIHGALFPDTKVGLSTKEETIASTLKKKGYATGMIGKWHLGDTIPCLPLQHGFEEYFGLPYSNDMWPVNFDGTPAAPDDCKSKYPAATAHLWKQASALHRHPGRYVTNHHVIYGHGCELHQAP